MKIDFLISSLSGGGAEKVITTLANEFAYDNVVNLISLEKRQQFYKVSEQINLQKIDNNNNKFMVSVKDMIDLKKLLRNNNADIIISFLSRTNLLLILLSLFNNKKIVVCDRNNPLKEHSFIIRWISFIFYIRANKIIVQTEKIKSFYPKYLRKKIVVIENPINSKLINQQIQNINIKKNKTIISIGRLEKQKDFKTIIKAFKYISEKYIEWNVEIYGVGNMKDEIEHMIKEYDLQERVLLKGRTDHPILKLKESSIFILSSYYEGFPNVLCEAMFSGTVSIASKCISGPDELIRHGENGYLFDIEDYITLSKIISFLIENEEIRDKTGAKGKESIKRLELSNIKLKWDKVILDVLS